MYYLLFPPWGRIPLVPEIKQEVYASRDPDLFPVALNKSKCEAVYQDPDGGCYYTTLRSCDCPRYKTSRLPCRHIFRLAAELHVRASVIEQPDPPPSPPKQIIPSGTAPPPEKRIPEKRKIPWAGLFWTAVIAFVTVFSLWPNPKPKTGPPAGSTSSSSAITNVLDEVRHVSPDDVSEPSSRSTGGGGGSREYVEYNTVIDEEEYTYIVNTSTRKIHYPTCTYVSKISPANLGETDDPEGLIKKGYSWCQKCHG